ncbi:protein GET1 [Aristolochia californica]|uniref:protein GET1 n=1 Tax=Aristolochia californica TaxID=171875 RepID=UPI0035DD0D69
METEKIPGSRGSLAPPLVFIFLVSLQLISRFLEQLKRKAAKSPVEQQLRQEIRQLLKEANSLSVPSTFAQAAKLRRKAAAKEKELAKVQELHTKEAKGSFDVYFKSLLCLKVLTLTGLSWWFWGVPIAVIPQQLLRPFGKVLSWKAGESIAGHVTVGIVPWILLATRVSKFISQKFP